MKTSRIAEAVTDRIERSSALDGLADRVSAVLGKVIPSGPVEDVLSGTPVGHPIHPALVAVPIGAWTSSLVLDAMGEDDAARLLVGIGIVSALPASATGASDWMSTAGAERRVGLVHALTNYSALAAFGLSWVARGRGHRGIGVGLSVVGTALVSAAGWLGGHLSYAQGVGVDTTVFESLPEDWADAGAEEDLPAEGELVAREIDGVPVLLTRLDGEVRAMADRCTHRGAPLHEGEIADGCVVCPWHASAFDLTDGSVQAGPATRPQRTFETRTRYGRLEVRRDDPREVGTRSVGS